MKKTIITLSTLLCSISLQAETVRENEELGPRKLPKKLIKKFDTDGDGKLNASEREAAKNAAKAKHADRRAKALEKFDADGDGKLNEAERKAASEARKARVLEKFDTNGDGELNETEKEALKKAMQKRRGFRGPKERAKRD